MLRPLLDEMLSPFLNKLSDTSTCFNDTNRDTVAALKDCNHTMRFIQVQLQSLENRFDTVERKVNEIDNKSGIENKFDLVQPLSIPEVPAITLNQKDSIQQLVLPVILPGAIAGQSANSTMETKSPNTINSMKWLDLQCPTNKGSNRVQSNSTSSPETSISQTIEEIVDNLINSDTKSDNDVTMTTGNDHQLLASVNLDAELVKPRINSSIAQKKADPPKPLELAGLQFTTLSEFSDMSSSDTSRRNFEIEDGEIFDDTITCENLSDRRVQANTDTLYVCIENSSTKYFTSQNNPGAEKCQLLDRSHVDTTLGATHVRKRQRKHVRKRQPKRPMNSILFYEDKYGHLNSAQSNE